MIYLDHAATSLGKPKCVADAVGRAMCTMGNPGRGSHEASLAAARMVYGTRKKLADFFGMRDVPGASAAERVIFTANATEGANLVIKGLLSPGDHVITTELEHNSVLRPLYEKEAQGTVLTVVSCDAQGRISPDELEAQVQKHTRAIVCTHASNVTGNVNNIREIGEICKKYNLYFILDAAQTAGSLPIDMERDHISALIFTGHKGLLGPQGTGGVCLAPGVMPRPLKSGGSGSHSFDKKHPLPLPEALEAGTLNVHGIAGLDAALSYIAACGGVEQIHRQEMEVFLSFYRGIRTIPGIRVLGAVHELEEMAAPKGEYRFGKSDALGTFFEHNTHLPIVSLNVADISAGEIADALAQEYGIAVRAGVHCAPLLHTALGTAGQGAVRFSFSLANTVQEAKTAAQALAEIAKSYRGRVISYVGAGGKTGSIKADARAFAEEGKKVLITTSTKMAKADVAKYPLVEIPEQTPYRVPHTGEQPGQMTEQLFRIPSEIPHTAEQPQRRYGELPDIAEIEIQVYKEIIYEVKNIFNKYSICAVGMRREESAEKFGMPPLSLLERLLYEADVILIEADGAAHKLIKAPEAWEPVVLPFTDEVAVVMGVSAVGQKVKDVCHRETKVLEILSCEEEHCLTEADLTRLMEEGYEKPVRMKYPYMEFRKIYYHGGIK